MKQKLIYTDLDNVFNTGILKYMIIEMVAMCIMPYPFLMDVVYYEDANDFSAGIAFQWNDFLLCLMMFIRLIFIFRVALNNSFYTDPRAQRVCNIYGTDASYYFALKCIMKNDSWIILTLTLPVTLLTFSYQLMLFERHVNASFDNFTTAMWNVMITMLTIGYGDVYPKSHMGRLIGIVIAGWGAFYVSLFVVALNNMLELDSPETKAFMLLQRLLFKDDLREEAACALASAYKLKLAKAKPGDTKAEQISHIRRYRTHMQSF